MELMNWQVIGWVLVIVAGPLALFLALNWGKARSAKQDREIDPARPSDDPAKGMGPSR